MKILALCLALILLTTFSYAKNYEKISDTIIKISETKTEETSDQKTIQSIREEIASKNQRIIDLQGTITEIEAEKVLLEQDILEAQKLGVIEEGDIL